MPAFLLTPITPGLQSGVDIINQVESQRFPLLLNRVSQCIQNKSNDLNPFSEEEEEKLITALGISQPKLKLLLNCSTLILKQAAFNITKPTVLQQQLSEHLKLNEDKVEAFVSTWTSQAKDLVTALKRKSTHPNQVEGVSWLLDIAVGSSEGQMLEPRAVVELKVQDSAPSYNHLKLDLSHSQLLTLYETLETIQSQLDNLR